MADEETVLKKKLEETTDFEERRAIRQQLRDLRKKKLDALESGTAVTDRPRRRERVKKEEQTTVITDTKTTDDSSHPATQTKIEVNYSHTITTCGPPENGIEDESREREGSETKEENSVSEDGLEEQQVGNGKSQFNVQINGEKSPQDSEPEQVDSTPQEQSTDSETATESSGTAAVEAVPVEGASNKDQTEEVELTLQVVETIEDVDTLERLLKEVPLNEYALRKAIRLQIRQLRVKKEASKENANLLGLENIKQIKHNFNLPESQPSESLNVALETTENDDSSSIKTETVFTVPKQTEAGDAVRSSTGNEHLEKGESDCDVDDDSSTQSSITSEGPSEPDNPGKPPPRPPRPSKTPSTASEGELTGDFKSRILGKPAAPPPRDLSKKGKPLAPEQVDFRGQLKKTGLRADKDLTAQGKRKQQLSGGQLKIASADASRNLPALKSVDKKKEGPVQVDFRGNLKRMVDEGGTTKKVPPRPPPTYLTKVTNGGTSQSLGKSKIKEAPPAKEQGKPDENSEKVVRKISSADLLNMLHKPVESSKEGYLVQRGLKKAEASKSAPQKFGTPSVDTSTEDEKFKARMAWRKERSDKQFLPLKGAKTDRKMSAGVETKDFQAVLKKASVQQSKPLEKSADHLNEEDSSADASKRNERFSVDIQNKDELQKLRADLLREKEMKDKDGVSTTTEKVTEAEQIDGVQMTKEVTKTTEVHKGPGGATMTVTKTTSKTEVRQTGLGKGTSIEAMLAQKRKEKMMAKKQQQADTKNKRMAFKEKLEAQSPKVAGGGRNFQSGNAAINSLQEWCRRRTKYHEGVDIQNFTTSWANGLAMCALLNYFLPEKVPFDTLDPKDKRGNWTLAFKVANEEGIEPLLELEDVMVVDVPEPKSLITYIHFIYQHFTEKQQQQK